MLRFDGKIFAESFPQLLKYLPVTLGMVALSLVIGILLGILLAFMKVSGKAGLRKIADGYTTVIRCTPSIVLLFLVYYGLPKIVLFFGYDMNGWSLFFYVVVTYALMSSGGLSEVLRSAYEAVPKGQREAALSIGLTRLQTFRRVVFPQALVVALPNLGNTVIATLKNGSLAYTIGFVDMMGKAMKIIAKRYSANALETYTALAVIYWILCILIEQFIKLLEQKGEKRKDKIAKTGGWEQR